MENLAQLTQPFFLTMCRLTPFFSALSLLPMSKFPMLVRLVCLLVLSAAITQLTVTDWQVLSQPVLLVSLGSEWVLGMLMIIGFQFAYASILIIGKVLDLQIGFAAAGVIDPVSNNTDPLLGTALTLFFSVAFFLTNTHHQVLSILLEVFALIPQGSWNGEFDIYLLASFFATQMALGIILLGPIIMGLWLLDIFNGIIAKTMPQMNVYFVMLPLKIGVGLFMLSIAMGLVKPVIQQIFDACLEWLRLGWIS